MTIFYLIITTITVFSVFGFILSNLLKKPNERLFNIKKISEELIKSNSWLKALAPFITVFYLSINFLLWGIFALDQILKFIVMTIQWVKTLFIWVWNSIIEPTIILVIKMIWHYPIVFIWKNTELLFSVLRPALNLNSLKVGAKELSKLMVSLFLLYIIHSLVNQTWFSVFTLIVSVLGSIYTFITVGLIFSDNKNIKPTRTNILNRLSVIIGFLTLVLGSLILLTLNNEKIFISEISFPLSEIGIPIAITLLFTLIMSVPFGVAYFIQSDSSMNFGQFFRAMITRLPKLIYSLPFQAIGILITLIIPIAIYLTLNQGITLVSGKNISEHLNRVEKFSDLDNQYFDFSNKIDSNTISIQKADSILVSDSIQAVAYISEMNQAIEEVNSKKTTLMQKQIFLLNDNFYVGERQSFSFPPIINCESFQWEITDSEDVVIVTTVKADSINSSLFSYKWTQPGSYTVSVVPKNTCEDGQRYTAEVKVISMPERVEIFTISGPSIICANDTCNFSVTDTTNSLEWIIPNDAKIIEGRSTNEIKVVWGEESGIVSLKGNENQKVAKYSYLKVMAKPILGKIDNGIFNYPESNTEDFETPIRPFTFYELQRTNDSIMKIEFEIKQTKDILSDKRSEFLLFSNSKVKENKKFSSKQIQLCKIWFSNLFSMIGLIIILLLLLTPALSYFFKFNSSLYVFHEKGKHYISNELDYLKTKDPKQPLFGWFIVTLIAIIMTLVSQAEYLIQLLTK